MDLKACALGKDESVAIDQATVLTLVTSRRPLHEVITPSVIRRVALANMPILEAGRLHQRAIPQALLWLNDSSVEEWF